MKPTNLGALAAIVLAGALAIAPPVDAAVMQATVKGTVLSWQSGVEFPASGYGAYYGYDGPGMIGREWTATFIFDTTLGETTFGPTSADLTGGADLGTTIPVLASTFTLNGLTIQGQHGDFFADVQYDWGSNSIRLDTETNSVVLINLNLNSLFVPTSLSTPFESSATAFGTSYFRFTPGDYLEVGTLTPTSISVIAMPAPEPGTWAMLLAGFGCVGSLLRSRSRAQSGIRRGRIPG